MWLMHEKQPFTAILEKDLFELHLTLLLPAGGGGGGGFHHAVCFTFGIRNTFKLKFPHF